VPEEACLCQLMEELERGGGEDGMDSEEGSMIVNLLQYSLVSTRLPKNWLRDYSAQLKTQLYSVFITKKALTSRLYLFQLSI
jgi:hypothetical protein